MQLNIDSLHKISYATDVLVVGFLYGMFFSPRYLPVTDAVLVVCLEITPAEHIL